MNLTQQLQTSNEEHEVGSHLSCCISLCIPDSSHVLVFAALYAVGCCHMAVLRALKTVCELELKYILESPDGSPQAVSETPGETPHSSKP